MSSLLNHDFGFMLMMGMAIVLLPAIPGALYELARWVTWKVRS